MDEQKQARIIGLALARGLVGEAAIREAAASASSTLLETLLAKGYLDEIDVEVLSKIPDHAMMTADPVRQPLADSWPANDEVWQDPPTCLVEDGREVRESFTLRQWRNYLDLQFVAEGGLGRIFKAFDPRLKRTVALKFLRRDDPDLLKRFVLEAQHQARVEHPNICKVFEVDEWKGQAFIAMQYIHGETLETAAPRMSLAEKTETMEIVAEALHAAHREGLTHRDIKPANIMIEHMEGEKFKPYILDFGLAKDLESSGLTMEGMLIGTMHYMAPEQVLGDSSQIGRRTDVYGLGATLYRILTGRMVFQGTESLDSARRILEEDPASPRRWVADLPKDLETIVLKCLEKDAERRYESALALSEDLRRFREGEPIQAQPASRSYRLGKFARKHRWLVGFAAMTLATVLGTVAWGISTSLRARKTAALASAFSAEAENMAASMRMAYLLPRHSISLDKALVRTRLERVRQTMQKEGAIAEGPGAYALGQGHLVLHELPEARKELEQAWSKGYRNPRVALALGQTLGELYQDQWDELAQISDLGQREARKQVLARDLRDPALAFLKLGTAEEPEHLIYHEGLLAFYGEQYELAIAKAREAFRLDPGLYEAKMLEGKALVALGISRQYEDTQSFREFLKQAEQPFSVALDIARSDPELLFAEDARQCELARYAFMYGRAQEKSYEDLQNMLDGVLGIDPEMAEVYVAKGRLAWSYAVFEGDHGRDALAPLDQAIPWCEKASGMRRDGLGAESTLGEIFRWKGYYRLDRGLDPTEAFNEALRRFREVVRQRPGDAWMYERMADVSSFQGDWDIGQDIDPRPILSEGIRNMKESLRLGERGPTAIVGANLFYSLGNWFQDHGDDPEPSYAQALTYYQLAARLSPDDGDAYTGIASIAVPYALYRHQVGGPTEDLLKTGLNAAIKSVQLYGNYVHLLNYADVLRAKAQFELEGGEDPTETLRRAESLLERCQQLNATGDYLIPFTQAQVAILSGQAELIHHRSPMPSWSRAETLLKRCARMNHTVTDPWVWMARLAWLKGRSGEPEETWKEGFDAVANGFRVKARQPELLALRGCLFLLKADASGPDHRNDFQVNARKDLESAISSNRFLVHEFGPELTKARM